MKGSEFCRWILKVIECSCKAGRQKDGRLQFKLFRECRSEHFGFNPAGMIGIQEIKVDDRAACNGHIFFVQEIAGWWFCIVWNGQEAAFFGGRVGGKPNLFQ